MTSSSSHPGPDEVARMTSETAELLEVLWGRASTAPVSPAQIRVLFILEHHDGINLRTLADTLGSSPPSASRLCDRLQALGFVEREPGAAGRRELSLRLSRRGQSFLVDLRARREQALRSVLERMPTAKRTALVEGLEAFHDAAAERIHEGDAFGARSA